MSKLAMQGLNKQYKDYIGYVLYQDCIIVLPVLNNRYRSFERKTRNTVGPYQASVVKIEKHSDFKGFVLTVKGLK